MKRYIKFIGLAFTPLTGLACLIIVVMLAIILGNIAIHGGPRLSWEFISSEPRAGMTQGGIFPAIFGTAALVLLMTLAVVPLGVAAAIYLHEYARPGSQLVDRGRPGAGKPARRPRVVFWLCCPV